MRSPELFVPDARAAVREAAASDPAAAVTAPMPWDRHLRAAALASVAMAVPDRVVTNATRPIARNATTRGTAWRAVRSLR